MGCWNGTCGLSGLPIVVGTEIYIFPIVETYRDSFCYSTALYYPMILPFRAVYNDYGGGENCSGVGLDFVMNHIAENLIEMEVGRNPYHDIAVKRKGFNADVFFEACHEHRLKFSNPMRGYHPEKPLIDVFFTMVRKDVVDRLWNEWTFDVWKGIDGVAPEGFESDQHYVKNVTYAKKAALISNYLETRINGENGILKEFEEIFGDLDEEKKKRCFESFVINYFFRGKDNHLLSRTFSHLFETGYSDGGYARVNEVKQTIAEGYVNGGEEGKKLAVALLEEAMITAMVNRFMENTRKVWLPVMHQGSQSEEYDEYLLLNKIANDVIAERKKEWEEDWDDEVKEEEYK